MEIVECPKCGRPRALGHRCPSCGDVATAVDKELAAHSDPWQRATAEPDPEPDAMPGPKPGPKPDGTPTATPDVGRPVAVQPATKSRRKRTWNLVALAVVALAIVAIAVTIALPRDDTTSANGETGGIPAMMQAQMAELTGEGTARPRQEATDYSNDQLARAVLERAMQIMNDIIVDLDIAREYPTSQYKSQIREALKTKSNLPIRWVWGNHGVYAEPHSSAQAAESTVSWAFIPPKTFELGTWSASGAAIGVRVDKEDGSITFYKNGEEGF